MPPRDTHHDDDLFRRTMSFVRHFVRRLGADEVAQVVRIAIFAARGRYDASRGATLDTFVRSTARFMLLTAVHENDRLVRLSVHSPSTVKAFVIRLSREGRVSLDAMRARFSWMTRRSDDDVQAIVDWCLASDARLDAPRTGDAEGHPQETEGPGLDAMEDAVQASDALAEIERLGSCLALSPVQWRVLRERILADDPKTLAELGGDMGVSAERVRQIEAEMLARFRAILMRERHPWVEKRMQVPERT